MKQGVLTFIPEPRNPGGPPVVYCETTGILMTANVTTPAVGIFIIPFAYNADNKYYQVMFSTEDQFVDFTVENKTAAGFTLHTQQNGADYDPPICVLAVVG